MQVHLSTLLRGWKQPHVKGLDLQPKPQRSWQQSQQSAVD